MSLATTLLSLSVLVPVPQGGLKLPPKPVASETARGQDEGPEIERFRRDVQRLQNGSPRLELELQEMYVRYPKIQKLIIEMAKGARQRDMEHLLPVARRFGTVEVADELQFQLMARPLGGATRKVVDAMVFLMGDERDLQKERDEKDALRQCIRGRIAGLRRPATEALAALATAEDLPFAVALTSEAGLDLQLRGVDLLATVGGEAAVARLVKLLSKGPALAGYACTALIAGHEGSVAALTKVLEGPPIDRGYCYSAFALAEIGEQAGELLLSKDWFVKLDTQLRSREPLVRCLAAIALADLIYHGVVDTSDEEVGPDLAIGDALLDVVDGRQFVPNLDMLRRPALHRLQRMTGRAEAAGSSLSWREWWDVRRPGFVGVRASVAVTPENADRVTVTLQTKNERIRLLGEGLVDRSVDPRALEIVLTKERMNQLAGELVALGFGNPAAMRCDSALPVSRSLELQVGSARAHVGMPAGEHLAFDGLVSRLQLEIDRELWQLYRDPKKARAQAWREESVWLAAHPDPTERARRFGRRVFACWPTLTPRLRARALESLFSRKDLAELFDERDGDRILAIVRASQPMQEFELRLLELAVGLPGDKLWRDCVDLAARKAGGGRAAVRAVFAVLGPDKVLEALADERPVVRRVAVEEVSISRDLRGGARVVEMLGDEDEMVRGAAARACGLLRLAAAEQPLIALVFDAETAQAMRHECLLALGRVGGEKAFDVLAQALRSPVQQDREAGIRGLGELRDVRAAHTLAELGVIAHGSDLGSLARFHLGRMGARFAVPALRQQVNVVTDLTIRTELVLLLGAYQDPSVIPELMDLLRGTDRSIEARQALMCTTGLDLVAATDPWLAVDQWYRDHGSKPQWKWLLDALQQNSIPCVLKSEHFAPAAGLQAVPELARLLADLEQPRLWVLTAAVLRGLTKEDYGVVTARTGKPVRAGIAGRYRLLFEARSR